MPKLPPAFKNIWVTREPQTGKKGWSQDWVVKGPIAGHVLTARPGHAGQSG